MWVNFPGCSEILGENLYKTNSNETEVLFRVNDGKVEIIGTGTGIKRTDIQYTTLENTCIYGTSYKTEFKPLYAFCAGCAIGLIIYIIWKIMLEKVIGR